MKKLYYLTMAFATISLGSQAQSLNQNNVNASLYDNGFFFTDSLNSVAGYEVPAGSGNHAIFSGSFWFGGPDVNGQMKMAAQRYAGSGNDYWGGPSTRHTPNEWAPNDWSTIKDYFGQTSWTVTKAEIDYHVANYQSGTYVMPTDIANWPAHGDTSLGNFEGMLPYIAPFVDVNNNGQYEPTLGDYPCIKGDAVTYIIMSDVGGFHSASSGEQVQMELHFMYYQYSTIPDLENTTFVDVEIVNMGNQTLYDTKAAFFLDADIGNAADDFVGTDTLRNMIYTYNGDNLDETNGGALGYGVNPPALGLKVLSHNLDHSIAYSIPNLYPYTGPNISLEYYNSMNGDWVDGSDQLDNNNQSTDYSYTGDPNTPGSWSENNIGNLPGDRRKIASTDLGTFNWDYSYGAVNRKKISYAFVYARGTDNLNSVAELQATADVAQTVYDTQNSNCFDINFASVPENQIFNFTIQPNPNNGTFVISAEDAFESATARIYDSAGKLVYVKDIHQGKTQINPGLSPGMYYLELDTEISTGIQKFVVQ